MQHGHSYQDSPQTRTSMLVYWGWSLMITRMHTKKWQHKCFCILGNLPDSHWGNKAQRRSKVYMLRTRDPWTLSVNTLVTEELSLKAPRRSYSWLVWTSPSPNRSLLHLWVTFMNETASSDDTSLVVLLDLAKVFLNAVSDTRTQYTLWSANFKGSPQYMIVPNKFSHSFL